MNINNILAVDTALSNSVSLCSKNNQDTFSPAPGEHLRASKIMVVIDELLKKNSIKPKDLDAIALNIGPGSFTGIRIGIALVKGIARPFDIPVVPANSFQAIATNHKSLEQNCIIINAGGGYFYYAKYENNSYPTTKGKILRTEQILEKMQNSGELILYGKRLEKLSDRIKSEFRDIKISEDNSPLAPIICEIATELLKSDQTTNFRNLEAYYIKPSYVDI